MRFIRLITEEDAGFAPSKHERTAIRQAARAVVFGIGGNIALLYVAADNYHKLPGGGLEHGESIEQALRREVLEETGCSIELLGEVGMIEEHRSAWGISQTSYCYIAAAVGEYTEPSFTTQEVEHGFELDWVSPEDALLLIRDSVPQTYLGKFVQMRDQIFLQEAMKAFTKVRRTSGSM